MTITAAADGSALGNPGPAGWAWYIDDNTWRAGGWPHGTNNMGELTAVLDLLQQTAVAVTGPVTAEAAARLDIPVSIMPTEYTVGALVQAIADHYQK